jgi:hypothetical protein
VSCAQLGLNHAKRTDRVILDARVTGDAGQGLKRGVGAAVFGHEAVKGRRTNPARSQETKPGYPIIFRGGWEWGVSGRMWFLRHQGLVFLLYQVVERGWLTGGKPRTVKAKVLDVYR